MTELEELMKQKKEIEDKIKELKEKGIVFTNAKYGIQHYACFDQYYVAVRVKNIETMPNRERYTWKHIINRHNKEELLPVLREIIKNLTELADEMEKRGEFY